MLLNTKPFVATFQIIYEDIIIKSHNAKIGCKQGVATSVNRKN